MQISLSGYQNSLFFLDVQRQATQGRREVEACPAASVFRPSSLTLLAASNNFSQVSIQDQTLTMTYRRDGSLAMRVQSALDVQARVHEASLEMTLSADALGLRWPADTFKDGPLQLSLDYHYETAEVDQKLTAQTVRPTRKAEDILMDLSEAISNVLRRKGDKNVQVLFDDEAVKALFSEAGASGLIKELAGLLCMINSMILDGGERDRYTIMISGKGKPYLDVQQQTQVQAETIHVRFNLTILPPESEA